MEYKFLDNTYYSSTATLTTLNDDVAPTDLSVNSITANSATISWKGFGDSYNVRYSQGGLAKVTLSVPNDIWDDGSGYQMLLDKDHNTYGSVIPESGGLTGSGDASAETYAEFEYKIPTNADGAMNTSNVVDGSKDNKSVTIEIPAGIYDWCITNPSPNDRVWIASGNGNVGGRQDDFTFEAGKHYTFTVTSDDGSSNDCVNMAVEDDNDLAQGAVTEITGITGTSYTLSRLTASTHYTVFVQSVKGGKESDWSSVNFTTLKADELYLYDNQDNSTVLANSVGQTVNVTLQGRTLYKDGAWNTLCLPFALTDSDTDTSHSSATGGRDGITFTGTLLEGAEVMGFDHATFTPATGTLEMVFNEIYTVPAGEPFLVRWTKADPSDPDLEDLVNPVFTGVTITSEVPQTNDPEGYAAAFIGTYGPVNIYTEARTNLYLGADNKLYYPTANDFKVKSCRAYFQLKNGLTAGEPDNPNAVRAFVLNFGEERPTLVSLPLGREAAGAWYTLDGRKILHSSFPHSSFPKGLYIHGGRKIVIP